MNAAIAAQLVAWNVVIDRDLRDDIAITAEDGRVTIHRANSQPASAPYNPDDTLGGLYRALDAAVQDLH